MTNKDNSMARAGVKSCTETEFKVSQFSVTNFSSKKKKGNLSTEVNNQYLP